MQLSRLQTQRISTACPACRSSVSNLSCEVAVLAGSDCHVSQYVLYLMMIRLNIAAVSVHQGFFHQAF